MCTNHYIGFILLLFFFFTEDVPQTQYCEITLTDANLKAFSYAVKNHYWYQMYIDDLPIWGEYCP